MVGIAAREDLDEQDGEAVHLTEWDTKFTVGEKEEYCPGWCFAGKERGRGKGRGRGRGSDRREREGWREARRKR